MRRAGLLLVVAGLIGCAGGDEDAPPAMMENDSGSEQMVTSDSGAGPMCVPLPDCSADTVPLGIDFFPSPTCPGRICSRKCTRAYCVIHQVDTMTGQIITSGNPSVVDVYCGFPGADDCNSAKP